MPSIAEIRAQCLPNALFILEKCQPLAPKWLQGKLVSMLFNQVFVQSLHEGDWDELEHRPFGLALGDNDIINLVCVNGQIRPAHRHDCVMRVKSEALAKLLLQQEDADALFFNRQLSMEGDTELALEIKHLLDNVDPQGFFKVIRGWLKAA